MLEASRLDVYTIPYEHSIAKRSGKHGRTYQDKKGLVMIELVRSNDRVLLSWLIMRFKQEDINNNVLDTHMAAADGSISAIQCRVMVDDHDVRRARLILYEAEDL